MKIVISFTSEPGDIPEHVMMGGMTVAMDDIDDFSINTSVDIADDGNGGKLPMQSGSLNIQAHGLRALWTPKGI